MKIFFVNFSSTFEYLSPLSLPIGSVFVKDIGWKGLELVVAQVQGEMSHVGEHLEKP